MTTAIIILGASGLNIAKQVKAVLPGSKIHCLISNVEEADIIYTNAKEHIRTLFENGTTIIGICASAILIRSVAPVLDDKTKEPSVIAVAEDGSAVVPLLGGHNGANQLAKTIADEFSTKPSITTAGDLRFGLALDEPPRGWHVANPEAAKGVMAKMLSGDGVDLQVEAGEVAWLRNSGAPFKEGVSPSIHATHKVPVIQDGDLILHPTVLALGVGCERGTEPDELIALVRDVMKKETLAEASIACVASIDLKSDEPAIHALAKELGIPVRFFSPEELEAQAPYLQTPSEIVFKEVGCHGVSEGAALAAAGGGKNAVLAAAKFKSNRATCAVALANKGIDPLTIGKPQGVLSIVGVGPGTPKWRTPEVSHLISQATDVVGYQLYLDLIAPLIVGKQQHESALAQEENRVRRALDLAAEGRNVALVCSGDAGIYALATLAFELLDRENRGDWNRVAVQVSPGISAIQAAAARTGAPIGHDFCTVSLSDLLTPWEDIERRLKAVADGDFIVALYNPVSKRRRTQLPIAREILLTGRPPETPVILARNLGRDDENIRSTTLGELTPDHADMLTLVLIGNSNTKLIKRGENTWIYTPRGYAKKMEPLKE
ncbi:MAG: precorrin-3B C(17)-methyltransferase [Rhodospirillales bacterium]|nr:precorrin-3B C(17)-methyltransferase [Rhodospirillales bacterium]